MTVLVDTSVWSLALRRKAANQPEAAELAELIREGRAALIGPIRQELLSGVRTEQQYRLLRDRLRAFPDLSLNSADYEDAATFYNLCRSKGVQGSSVDLLICAVARRRGLAVFTTDGDFVHYARIINIRMHDGRR